jgi:hypothetical protein
MGLFDDLNVFSGDSGLNKALTKNPIMATALPGGFLSMSYFNKKKANQALDDQMVDPGSPQPWIDPNDMGEPPAGGSAYSRMQHQLNGMGAQRSMEQAATAGMGDTSQARSALAERGGVSSGASERLAMTGMANQANARQLAAGDLSRANLTGDIADEGMRRSAYNQIRMRNQDAQNALYAGNNMSNATLNANRPKGALGLGFLGL